MAVLGSPSSVGHKALDQGTKSPFEYGVIRDLGQGHKSSDIEMKDRVNR